MRPTITSSAQGFPSGLLLKSDPVMVGSAVRTTICGTDLRLPTLYVDTKGSFRMQRLFGASRHHSVSAPKSFGGESGSRARARFSTTSCTSSVDRSRSNNLAHSASQLCIPNKHRSSASTLPRDLRSVLRSNPQGEVTETPCRPTHVERSKSNKLTA